VRLQKHPNADNLSIVQVFGYQVCTGTKGWMDLPATFLPGETESCWLGAYIPPDSLVPVNRPEFDFLAPEARPDGYARIKAKKLRQVVSFGLLVPAPAGSKIGDNVADLLGVKHYEPPLEEEKGNKRFATGGEVAKGPDLYFVKYDLEAFRRYSSAFQEGEPVYVTEKLDGSNGRYVNHAGKMYCGSRTEWKKEFPSYEHLTVEGLVTHGMDEERAKARIEELKTQPVKKNLWWYALELTPNLRKFCEKYPDLIVYGEVFGRQGKLKYTTKPDEVFFAAFDIMKDGKWINFVEARNMLEGEGVPCAPLLNQRDGYGKIIPIPYNFNTVAALDEGPSLWFGANCIREGVVVSPEQERYEHCGRVKMKVVSATYLGMKSKDPLLPRDS
jgi:RNA ligase (TIGR02306 family)